MKLVDTETPNPDRFARTADGKIDFDAYKGLTATYRTGDLDFEVTILDSRQRFGHLDLLVTPVTGSGDRWVEFKNLTIHNDPALSTASKVAAAPAAVAPFVPMSVTTTVLADEEGAPLAAVTVGEEGILVELIDEEDEEDVSEFDTVSSEPALTPVATVASENYGTHWTEKAPVSTGVATEVVEDSTTSDMEVQVETILNEDSPVIK
jgi:hypothetical protein